MPSAPFQSNMAAQMTSVELYKVETAIEKYVMKSKKKKIVFKIKNEQVYTSFHNNKKTWKDKV